MIRHWRLAASLAALAALTLGPKIALHGSLSMLDAGRADQLRTERFLADNGWSRQEAIVLTLDGSMPAARYARAGCATGMTVVIAPPRADAFPLIGALARDDDRIVFIFDGRALDQPPSNTALLRWKFARILRAVTATGTTTRGDASSAILGVVVPPDCPAARDIPWSAA